VSDEPTNIIDIRPLLREREEERLKEFWQKIADTAAAMPHTATDENPKP
jgi:hypothetical protein